MLSIAIVLTCNIRGGTVCEKEEGRRLPRIDSQKRVGDVDDRLDCTCGFNQMGPHHFNTFNSTPSQTKQASTCPGGLSAGDIFLTPWRFQFFLSYFFLYSLVFGVSPFPRVSFISSKCFPNFLCGYMSVSCSRLNSLCPS